MRLSLLCCVHVRMLMGTCLVWQTLRMCRCVLQRVPTCKRQDAMRTGVHDPRDCIKHCDMATCVLQAWADCPDVTTPLLKFMAEFVFNKSTRLTFDASSPNGILLFRWGAGCVIVTTLSLSCFLVVSRHRLAYHLCVDGMHALVGCLC